MKKIIHVIILFSIISCSKYQISHHYYYDLTSKDVGVFIVKSNPYRLANEDINLTDSMKMQIPLEFTDSFTFLAYKNSFEVPEYAEYLGVIDSIELNLSQKAKKYKKDYYLIIEPASQFFFNRDSILKWVIPGTLCKVYDSEGEVILRSAKKRVKSIRYRKLEYQKSLNNSLQGVFGEIEKSLFPLKGSRDSYYSGGSSLRAIPSSQAIENNDSVEVVIYRDADHLYGIGYPSLFRLNDSLRVILKPNSSIKFKTVADEIVCFSSRGDTVKYKLYRDRKNILEYKFPTIVKQDTSISVIPKNFKAGEISRLAY